MRTLLFGLGTVALIISASIVAIVPFLTFLIWFNTRHIFDNLTSYGVVMIITGVLGYPIALVLVVFVSSLIEDFVKKEVKHD